MRVLVVLAIIIGVVDVIGVTVVVPEAGTTLLLIGIGMVVVVAGTTVIGIIVALFRFRRRLKRPVRVVVV